MRKHLKIAVLAAQGFEPLVVPPTTTASQVQATGAKAVFLSNGPGDPATLTDAIKNVHDIISAKIPVFGICLGHQIIGHAIGGHTRKLKFGHHGCNHPVKDLTTGKVEISSQNHGFAVYFDQTNDVDITHINLNDQTVEGLRHKTLPVLSVQYHPEAAAGPHDSSYLFKRFYDLVATAN